MLDKFLISILKVAAFLVDFCEIINVFTAINTRAAAEVIKQYLIIFVPFSREIKIEINLSNLDWLSIRSTYRGADNISKFIKGYLYVIKKSACIPNS